MKIPVLFSAFLLAASLCSQSFAGPRVAFETTHGNFVVELNEKDAPISSANFLSYVKDGYYNQVVFHRVISDFMVQTGGFELKENGEISQKAPKAPIQNEAKNGLKNARGTIAMARTNDPHSATSQFFINHSDNDNLDHPSFDGWGYAVFGKVVEGMETIDKIAALETGRKTLFAGNGTQNAPREMRDVPAENVVIKSAKIVE